MIIFMIIKHIFPILYIGYEAENQLDMFLTGFKRFIQDKDRQTKNSLDPLHQEKRLFDPRCVHDLFSMAFYIFSANILSLLSPVKVWITAIQQLTDSRSRRTLTLAFIQVKSSFLLVKMCVLCEERKVTVIADVSGHAEVISKHTTSPLINYLWTVRLALLSAHQTSNPTFSL